MRSLLLLSLGLACAFAAGAQQPPPDKEKEKKGQDGTRISYSGGGIRGLKEVVADGVLVTAAEAREFQGEAGYHEPLPLRPRQVLPGIDVLKPGAAGELKVRSPFPIAVQFRSMDSAIVPASFKLLYGAMRVDITERITRLVKVEPGGFALEQAQVPPGKHKLVLVVQDEKQRTAEREIRLDVE